MKQKTSNWDAWETDAVDAYFNRINFEDAFHEEENPVDHESTSIEMLMKRVRVQTATKEKLALRELYDMENFSTIDSSVGQKGAILLKEQKTLLNIHEEWDELPIPRHNCKKPVS
jgi:hypothetical protein